VLRAFSWCTCCRHYPGAATGFLSAQSPSRINLPRKGYRVGLHIDIFEACSAFTHVAACTLALSPIRDMHFPKAPVASGWSTCRVGLSPTGKCRLCAAHTRCRREFIAATRSVTALKGMFGKPRKPVSIDDMNAAIARKGAAAK